MVSRPPHPDGASSASHRSRAESCSSASSRLDTPYGLASSSWELVDGTLTVRAVVPPNTTARVQLPGQADELEVGAGTHPWSVPFEPPPPAVSTPPWRDLVGEQA